MVAADEVLTAVPDLLGEGAEAMLTAALTGIGTVRRWWRSQVRHIPRRQIAVRYGVEVGWPDGRVSVETMVAEQAVGDPPAGTTVLQAPSGGLVWLWRYPFDPHLPGLAPAAHPHRVRELLDRLDLPPGAVQIRPRAYRPTRRAVLEVTCTATEGDVARWYLKILPPSRTRRIHDVHLAVAAALPAPRPIAADLAAGTLLLSEVEGFSLRELLVAPDAPLPDPGAIVDLQQRLAIVDVGVTKAPPRPFGVRRGAAALQALLPDHATTIQQIAAGATAAVDPDGPLVTIHGDLHEGQIIVADDRTLGLVDLDGTGPGRLLDDAATMLAHLSIIGRWHQRTRDRGDAYAAAYEQAVGRLVDPMMVRRRAAGVLLGLAAGSFSAGDPSWREEALARLALAADLAGLPHDRSTVAMTSVEHDPQPAVAVHERSLTDRSR